MVVAYSAPRIATCTSWRGVSVTCGMSFWEQGNIHLTEFWSVFEFLDWDLSFVWIRLLKCLLLRPSRIETWNKLNDDSTSPHSKYCQTFLSMWRTPRYPKSNLPHDVFKPWPNTNTSVALASPAQCQATVHALHVPSCVGEDQFQGWTGPSTPQK